MVREGKIGDPGIVLTEGEDRDTGSDFERERIRGDSVILREIRQRDKDCFVRCLSDAWGAVKKAKNEIKNGDARASLVHVIEAEGPFWVMEYIYKDFPAGDRRVAEQEIKNADLLGLKIPRDVRHQKIDNIVDAIRRELEAVREQAFRYLRDEDLRKMGFTPRVVDKK